MADLIGQPIYKGSVRQLEGTDPAVPATWNPQLQDLVNNDVANKQALDSHEAALNPHTQYALATALADHQGATPMDHPQGSVTDGHIGNRAPDQTLAPPVNAAGTLTQLTSWLANRIKAITGSASWWDAPVKTLAALWALFDAAAGHKHDGTAGNGPKVAASVVTVTPVGAVSATTVQAAVQELDAEKLDVNGKAADSAKLNGYVQNTAAVAGTIPVRDAGAKVPGSITGDADTVDGKHAADLDARAQGILTETTPSIATNTGYTKQIAVPAGAKQGKLVMSTVRTDGVQTPVKHTVVFGSAAANAADSWDAINSSYGYIGGFSSGAILGNLSSANGTLIGSLRNVYVSGGILYLTFYNEQSAFAVNYTVSWEVE